MKCADVVSGLPSILLNPNAYLGYNDEFEGCRFKQAGLINARSHTERCRHIIADVLMADEKDVEITEEEIIETIAAHDITKNG